MLGIKQLTYTAMIGFLIVVILGPIFIPMLARFKFGQTVRDEGPQSHLAKNVTPTMGGVMMIVAILITGLTRAKISQGLIVGLICIVGFGFVGFLDDFIKIKMKRSLGLKAYQKIILQFALALYIAYYQYSASPSRNTTCYTIYKPYNQFRNMVYTIYDDIHNRNCKCS